jgi:CDP-diacylglycerol--glycerol-3-phosphate 3-phosphatidyltransferase
VPINLMPQKLPKGVQDAIGKSVGSLGITPNMISVFGFFGNLAAAWFITRGDLLTAGVIYLFFSALDLVDGAVARATGQVTEYGAVLDAILDRASECIVIAACGWYFAERGQDWQTAAAFVGLFGSVAVSYMRARAEVVGLSMRDGLFRRQERVALLGLGLLFSLLTPAVVILAALSNVTALQRFWTITRALRAQDRTEPLGQG